MENREQQILSEIKAMIVSVRSQLELLDAKMAELQQVVDPQDIDMIPIDLDIDMAYVAEPETVTESADDDLPFAEDPAPEPEPDPTPEPEPAPEPDPEPVVADPEPELELEPVPEPQCSQAVIDAMTARQAWRTDMPGAAVKDIRSAISLNDRLLFINTLFDEDPMAFHDSLTRINQMGSLDEVLGFIASEHPEWDLDSEVLYRFMMAVRRRIR